MPDGFTVFVVDDNAGIRRSITELCGAAGLNAETYGSAEEFLAAFTPQRRGCLLLDVRLRDGSGLDLQDKLRQRQITLPIIVMTAYGNVPTSVRAFKGGAVDFLQKPASPEVILQRIRHLQELDSKQRSASARRDVIKRRIASLTPRERQVMELLADGLISKEIAFELKVSTRTIEGHRRAVLRKMEATSTVELVRLVLSAR